ncbi:MAG TPA: PEP-CTERM sorting domain-containing protein [Bryobacteraceae bacterium]|nr:PEP-CTERM sorting domain-containing protein [Bryobacteraceae bacterium]
MNLTFAKHVFGGLLSAVILSAPLGATSIGAGQFNLAGNLYINTTSVLFGLNSVPPPGDQLAAIQLPETGPFSGLLPSGPPATIHNIPMNPAFPSGALSLPQWIVLPNGIDVDLQNVPINQSIAVCTGTSADNGIGNSCRPNTGSPIVLTETTTGVTAKLNVLGIAYSGTSTTGSSSLSGLLSANFDSDTISGLLSAFAPGGSGFVNTSYSGNFTVTPSSGVPEPSMLAGFGLGMLALGFYRRKRTGGQAK